MFIENAPYHDERKLPEFSLRQIDLPEILKWRVNGEYYLVMKVQMTGLRNNKDLNSKEDKSRVEADFQVHSIRALDKEPVDAAMMEKKDFEDTVTKVKSGDY